MAEDRLHAVAGGDEEVGESFTLFGKLPREIRYMIWEAALPGPRIVHVEQYHLPLYPCYRVRSDVAMDEVIEGNRHGNSLAFFDSSEIDDATFEDLVYADNIGPFENLIGYRSRCPPPVALFVCQESYSIASKHYPRAFAGLGASPWVRFNFQTDCLYLDWGRSTGIPFGPEDFPLEDAAKVRRIVTYEIGDFLAKRSCECYEKWLADVMRYFPNLETLALSRREPAHTPEESAELVFHNAIPAGLSMCYDSYENQSKDDDEGLFIHALNADRIILEDWVDASQLDQCRMVNLEEGSVLSPSPKIESMIITTPARKARLLRAEKIAQDYLDAGKPQGDLFFLTLPN